MEAPTGRQIVCPGNSVDRRFLPLAMARSVDFTPALAAIRLQESPA